MIPDFLIWSNLVKAVFIYITWGQQNNVLMLRHFYHICLFFFLPSSLKPVDKVSTASSRYNYRIPARSMTRIRYLSTLFFSCFLRDSKSDASSHESSKREAGEQSRIEVLWCICTWRAVTTFCLTHTQRHPHAYNHMQTDATDTWTT